MASIHQDGRTGVWQIAFRWHGEQYKRSAQTKRKKDAETLAGRVADTLKMLRTGHLMMSKDADPATWILSHGHLAQLRCTGGTEDAPPLGQLCDLYLSDQKHKADNTLMGERIHVGHFKRILREWRPMARIDFSYGLLSMTTSHVCTSVWRNSSTPLKASFASG